MDNRWWGVVYQVIPSKMFLSHSAEKVRGVTLQCFRKLLLRKNLWRRDGVLLRSVENFLSQSAEKIGGNHSKIQKNWGSEKIYA